MKKECPEHMRTNSTSVSLVFLGVAMTKRSGCPHRMTLLLMLAVLFDSSASLADNAPRSPRVTLRETATPTTMHDAADGDLEVAGQVAQTPEANVLVRVIDGRGHTVSTTTTARKGRFSCRYPADFRGATPLQAGFLFLDADVQSGAQSERPFRAEATIIVRDSSRNDIPEFVLVDCGEIYGDKLDGLVAWKCDADLSSLAGRPVRLRFVMSDADLYAFRFAKENHDAE